MYKIGLKLWSINTDYYYDEAIRLYKDGVFDYIELYVVPNSTDTTEKWKKLNIPFIIHCPHFAHGFNMAKVEKKESNLKIYKQVKMFADELSAKYIIFHGGIDGKVEETAKQLASFNEPRALIENKPMVALPNKMGGEFCRGYNPDEIRLIKEIAKCGFCLDFGHAICSANSQGKDIYEYCREFLQFEPCMFHLTDNKDITSPYDTHLHLGTGTLDIDKIKEMLPNDAIVTLETDKNSKENLSDFIGDSKWMKK
ncbi:MAG: sugar phosphate isomerase/epimerase family protein [Candidatus Gastranaerophilaceae bacterium]